MPPYTVHDVFSLDSPSVALNMRFSTLTAGGGGGGGGGRGENKKKSEL
jgi:hypothetical protein